MNWHLTILQGAGIVALLLIVWSIYRAQRDQSFKEFNLFDLLMENGRISKVSVIVMGSWIALTYAFIGMYFAGKMTEAVMGVYGGLCFAPLIAKMFSGAPPAVAP